MSVSQQISIQEKKVKSWFLENTDKTDKTLYGMIHQDTKKENKNDQCCSVAK